MKPPDRYLDAAIASNTRTNYDGAPRHYEVEWQGLLPASPQSVVRYLVHYTQTLSHSTLQPRLAALSKWHRDQGFTDPTRSPLVRQLFKGIRTVHGAPARQAKPLQIEQLAAVDAALTNNDRASLLRHACDRALILLGFWRGFRGNELIGLR